MSRPTSPSEKLQQVCRGAMGVLAHQTKPGWRLYAQGQPADGGVRCLRTNMSGGYCWGPQSFSSQWLANRLRVDGVRIEIGSVDEIVPARHREHFVGGGRR